MASLQSLGTHRPVGLPSLIAEGILPVDCDSSRYRWETYTGYEGESEVEEEVIATKTAVAWSQGNTVRKIYRYELEGEEVVQALLTTFHSHSSLRKTKSHAYNDGNDFRVHRPLGLSTPHRDAREPSRAHTADPRRALVIVLKTKIHVHFLQGSSHITDLPFEVERVFAAPRGILLQRSCCPRPSLPPTPQPPSAPPNSFFSSQPRTSLPGTQTSHLSKISLNPSPVATNPRLDSLFREVTTSKLQTQDEDVANLYSLSDPLSDLGVITYSVQHQRRRLASKKQSGVLVDFESLDPSEQILYVSPQDELRRPACDDSIPLILLVTLNDELDTVTLWHAWYLDHKSLRSVFERRAEQKAAKARRRSSFMSANFVAGTGTVTPAVRNREVARESSNVGTTHAAHDSYASQQTVPASRKSTQQQEEDAMASQMDPDYQPLLSKQPVRETRRISSMNTDARSHTNTINASFGGTTSRRAASYGGQHERRSLGHRRSRGSTPGSIFSRSIGADEDSMELDSVTDYDHEETTDGILRHIRETFDVSVLDNVIGNADQGFKREFTVRKIHSFSVAAPTSPLSNKQDDVKFKVVTLAGPRVTKDTHDERVKIFIQSRETKVVQNVEIQICRKALWPDLDTSPLVDIPLFVSDSIDWRCDDIIKLQDTAVQAVLFSGKGLLLSIEDNLCPIPPQVPYRAYLPYGLEAKTLQVDNTMGKNRILAPPVGPVSLCQPGLQGSYNEVDAHGIPHRRRLQLAPNDPSIERLLKTCEMVLPDVSAKSLRRAWCTMYLRLRDNSVDLTATTGSASFVAFVAAIFTLVIELVDDKTRAALNVSKLAWRKTERSSTGQRNILRYEHEQRLLRGCAWDSTIVPRSSAGLRHSPRKSQKRKDQLLVIAVSLAMETLPSSSRKRMKGEDYNKAVDTAVLLMVSLHISRQEQKLHPLAKLCPAFGLEPVIAQLGQWVAREDRGWGPELGSLLSLEGAGEESWAYVRINEPSRVAISDQYIGFFQWFDHALQSDVVEEFPLLTSVVAMTADKSVLLSDPVSRKAISSLTPRIFAISTLLVNTKGLTTAPMVIVEQMASLGLTADILDTLPGAVSAPFKEAISRCEKEPPTHWEDDLLELVGRADLFYHTNPLSLSAAKPVPIVTHVSHDLQAICSSLDQQTPSVKTKEASRHAVSQLIFSDDRRLIEAMSLMHFNSVQIAECPKQPEWDDAQHFDYQRRMTQWMTIRMISLPAGDGMVHFDCQSPLLTEKFSLPGFNSSCLMMPMGHTLTIDRTGLTEEKVNWAYFHAGVSAGLRISRSAEDIDTSWIAFNKPSDLTNRHAGFLLALGLGGHLRHLAKWLSFKYLTPKHTMTSVGLLLGLSASHIGTMDSLITRMLSVHITQMLPPGAAELNVSPATQTAGLMGIGLLYYNTQHRRMSEIMLGEIENVDIEDPDSGPDPLRDESYRLAAGFALGLINLAKGKNVRGLQGMQLSERLLAMAVGPKPINAVHVFDTASPGAVMSIALIYMKSGDSVIARKVDIPDTEAQFDQVRPDVLLLRTTAKHIILWDDIRAVGVGTNAPSWIMSMLPKCYEGRLNQIRSQVFAKRVIDSAHIPLFNITTGLAWALALKYAGSSDCLARDEILEVYRQFHYYSEHAHAYYFDGQVGLAALRRCIDMLAVCAATVMAGTGDLETFRYLRRLHGRIDQDTTYGSHLAAHMAIGILFLGGGTYAFGTSDLATAALMCAIYPLFPTDVHDNAVHLQAFRHFWVFAAEARCIVIEDIDTGRPVHMLLQVTMKNGIVKAMRAPCLLPELSSISSVQTDNPSYWRVTLDFASNPQHLATFRQTQRVLVRRSPAAEAYASDFSAAFAALNDVQQTALSTAHQQQQHLWHSIVTLPALAWLDRAEMELVLPPDMGSSVYLDERSTAVDERLNLAASVLKFTLPFVLSGDIEMPRRLGLDRDTLWNLRLLFLWADKAKREGDLKLRWLSMELVQELKMKVRKLEMSMSTV